jgi:hypothetical protein
MLRAQTILLGIALLIAVTWDSAYSQRRHHNPPANQTAEPAASEQRGTDPMPFTVKILPAPDAGQLAEKTERDRNEKAEIDRKLAFETQRIADYTTRLTWFTLLMFFPAMGQIVLFWVQLRYIRQGMRDTKNTAIAAKASADNQAREFLATHRPKIRVRHVMLKSDIWNKEKVKVTITCVNNGTTDATIAEFGMKFVFAKKDHLLPVVDLQPSDLGRGTVLPTGMAFNFLDVSDGTIIDEKRSVEIHKGDVRLYCLGFFHYLDPTQRRRTTAFCRVLTFPEKSGPRQDNGRFRVFDDPDYEYED